MNNKIVKLDLKDRKILYELDKNARISYSQLGKNVGLSTEAAHYRVKRLEESKTITGYHTAINFFKLGVIHFKICLTFNGISLEREEGFYQKIKSLPNVIWIVRCQGEYECMISCTVNDIFQFAEVKDKIICYGHDIISKKAVSILDDYYTAPRDFLVYKKREKITEKVRSKPVKLDPTDLRILKILSENSRTPITEIAKKMNSTIKIVSTRIKKLLKMGVILAFRTIINYDNLNLFFYKTFIYLKNPDEKRVKKLWNELKQNPHIIHNLKVIGEWDLEPEFEFENKEDFKKISQELMNNYSDIIKKISVINITKEYKYTFFYK